MARDAIVLIQEDTDRLGTSVILQALCYPWALTDFLSAAEARSLRLVRKSVTAALFPIWFQTIPRSRQLEIGR
jgi:hypothetical protein